MSTRLTRRSLLGLTTAAFIAPLAACSSKQKEVMDEIEEYVLAALNAEGAEVQRRPDEIIILTQPTNGIYEYWSVKANISGAEPQLEVLAMGFDNSFFPRFNFTTEQNISTRDATYWHQIKNGEKPESHINLLGSSAQQEQQYIAADRNAKETARTLYGLTYSAVQKHVDIKLPAPAFE